MEELYKPTPEELKRHRDNVFKLLNENPNWMPLFCILLKENGDSFSYSVVHPDNVPTFLAEISEDYKNGKAKEGLPNAVHNTKYPKNWN